GRWSEPVWLLPVGALVVTFWVGGFDVFYALQDEDFDRAERLKSLVVRLGQGPAIFAAKLLHGLALVALVLFGLGVGLGVAYYAGVAIGAALIVCDHRRLRCRLRRALARGARHAPRADLAHDLEPRLAAPRGGVRHQGRPRAEKRDGRRMGERARVRRQGPRGSARLGLRPEHRNGGLPLLDGYRGGDRARDEPLADRAGRRRRAQ